MDAIQKFATVRKTFHGPLEAEKLSAAVNAMKNDKFIVRLSKIIAYSADILIGEQQ